MIIVNSTPVLIRLI